MVLSPLYNSEQNIYWLSAENKQDYYKLKPYYTHVLNCSPYEVCTCGVLCVTCDWGIHIQVPMQGVTNVCDIQHNYEVLEYEGSEVN